MGNKFESFLLIKSLSEKKYNIFFALLYIYFAYLLGIIQDLYYGMKYFILILQNHDISGSFAFMLGWTALMLWGIIKPIERRIVLLLTSLLVTFMFIENILIFSFSKFDGNPFIKLIGVLLWFSTFMISNRISKENI